MSFKKPILAFLIFAAGTSFSQQTRHIILKIDDVDSGDPVLDAQITVSGKTFNTDAQGYVDLGTILLEEKIEVSSVDREKETRFAHHSTRDTIELRMCYTDEAQLRVWAEEDSLLYPSYREFDQMYQSGEYNSGITPERIYGGAEASFPGGKDALSLFLRRNLHYPNYFVKHEIEGKVWVQFRVQKDGQITHVKLAKKAHPGLDREALRVIRMMPLWQPMLVKGSPVVSYFNLPITFGLN